MRIAVTGGSGLVGRRLVRDLAGIGDVVNLDIRPSPDGIARQITGDILDPNTVSRAVRGSDAIVHAAAIPGPQFGTEEKIAAVNTDGTRIVAEAALRQSVRRLVFISSESVLGFVFSDGRVRPDYLPVDESHPLAPTDPYGRSKLRAESLLARWAATERTVVSLRPPWVWAPEEYEKCRRLTESPGEWSDGLWAYVHVDDLARVVVRAVTSVIPPGFHAAYVAAPDNGTVHPSEELAARYYPDVPLRRRLSEHESLIVSETLEDLLGERPRMSWREFL